MKTQYNEAANAQQGYSDAAYFADNPQARYRLSVRVINPKSGYYSFDIRTRGGGHITGDSWDMNAALQNFAHGTPLQRLLKAIRQLALRHRTYFWSTASDMVHAESGFASWARRHA